MAVERPTFHESWYRVSALRPRLLPSVRVYRQHFRGQMWYVLEEPATNQFSRLSEQAYYFVGLLDGRRTVAEAWKVCNEQLGDGAPTQGEVIHLLGGLYSSNLIQAELPPDTESLFNRYKTRTKRQIQGQLTNLLFIRIPLFDPDHFLNRWVNIFGTVFSKTGLVLWCILVSAGLYFVIGNFGKFASQSYDILSGHNLILLYLSFAFIKTIHEFSHSFACKKFGRLYGTGGQVHAMGIMFLVFFPLPYMDASSAWAFRNKWHRVVVGAAGMLGEIAVASIAAIIWANTSEGTFQVIMHNLIFIASVSTLLFNGNPLLRFDGYYILSDLIEIPNLGPRSRKYLYYLVKRYCWGMKNARSTAQNLGERVWFVFYGISSTIYRIFISIRILFFLNNRLPEQLFFLVPLLAGAAFIGWVLVPIFRFVHYLFAGHELARNRFRALATTGAVFVLLLCVTGIVRFPDYARVEGVVKPVRLSTVYAKANGFVKEFLPSGRRVKGQETVLLKAVNPQLEAEKKFLEAERKVLEVGLRRADTENVTAAQILEQKLAALAEKIKRVDKELSSLELRAPACGTWVAWDIESILGQYTKRGQGIGYVISLEDMQIRGTAGQSIAAMLMEEAYEKVELRVKGRPELSFAGVKDKIVEAGQDVLPTAALGHRAGGPIVTEIEDKRGMRAVERYFEVHIIPENSEELRLLAGQRVVARFELASKPLAVQWWRAVRQLFQRRFHI